MNLLLILVIIFVISLIIIILTQDKKEKYLENKQLIRSASGTSNVKYFGYYIFSLDYIKDIKDYCNVSLLPDNYWNIIYTTDTVNKILDINELIIYCRKSLEIFRSFGMKAVVSVAGIFFSNGPAGTYLLDQTTWNNNWNAFWLGLYDYLDVILCFYLDEPTQDYLNSIGGLQIIRNDINSLGNGVSINGKIVTKNDVHILICLIASWVTTYNVPDSIDWISFDEYCCFDSGCVINLTIPQKVQTLVNRYPNKKIMLIPGNSIPNCNMTDDQLCNIFTQMYYLALTTPTCVGLMAFLYENIKSSQQQINICQQIGREILYPATDCVYGKYDEQGKCVCFPGITGKTCSLNKFTPTDCSNQGRPIPNQNNLSCSCDTGWGGPTCNCKLGINCPTICIPSGQGCDPTTREDNDPNNPVCCSGNHRCAREGDSGAPGICV